MRFWLREFLGWVFMLLGLALLAGCVLLAITQQYVQGSVIAFVGFILFRAGVHFLKVAVAARVYLSTREPSAAEMRSNGKALKRPSTFGKKAS